MSRNALGGGEEWEGESILLNDKPNTWYEGDYESRSDVRFFFPQEKYFKEYIVIFLSLKVPEGSSYVSPLILLCGFYSLDCFIFALFSGSPSPEFSCS